MASSAASNWGQLGCLVCWVDWLGHLGARWIILELGELSMNQLTNMLLRGSAHADWNARRDHVEDCGKLVQDRFVVICCCGDDGMLL